MAIKKVWCQNNTGVLIKISKRIQNLFSVGTSCELPCYTSNNSLSFYFEHAYKRNLDSLL